MRMFCTRGDNDGTDSSAYVIACVPYVTSSSVKSRKEKLHFTG